MTDVRALTPVAPPTGLTAAKSAVSHVTWPAIPDELGAHLLAVQYELDKTQWLSRAELEHQQMKSLRRLLRHAAKTVPHYRQNPAYAKLSKARSLTPDHWARLPVLTRVMVQAAGESLRSGRVPADHLPLEDVQTSGSTGRPVRAVATRVTGVFWRAVTMRDHIWQQRDLSGTLASIRTSKGKLPDEGTQLPGWGTSTEPYRTGECYLLSVEHDVATQADWLVAKNPHYFLTLPSNLLAVAEHFLATGKRLPRLLQIRSYGEVVGDNVRDACRQAWGVQVSDVYSTQEVGYVALQCPAGPWYHVQSEVVYVEILNERGEACGPGETGRVVVSPLHNYGMPLLRYDVGDYAEVGEDCVCGRGLPVITKVLGRQRNMLAHPNGDRFWPQFGKTWREIPSITQLQLVQTELDHIKARIVSARPLTGEDESRFVSILHERFSYPFRVSFEYLDEIERSPSRKYEDFLSLVEPRP